MDADLQLAIEDFDLEDYLRQKDFDHVGGDEWQGECPHCLKKKVAVNTELKLFHCWICQETSTHTDRFGRTFSPAKGGVVSLIMWLEEMKYQEAVNYLIQNCNPEFDLESLSLGEEDSPTFKGYIDFPREAKPIRNELPYLAKRGLTLEDAIHYNLHFATEGKYANRLIFPVYENRKLMYWQARAMYDEAPAGMRYIKVLNPPKEPGAPGSKDVVFNLDLACEFEKVVITEGPIDAIKAGPEAVATFGKTISPVQVSKLIKAGAKEFVLMWDADAYKDAQEAAKWLASFLPTYLVNLPTGDPGQHERQYLSQLIHSAPRVYPQ